MCSFRPRVRLQTAGWDCLDLLDRLVHHERPKTTMGRGSVGVSHISSVTPLAFDHLAGVEQRFRILLVQDPLAGLTQCAESRHGDTGISKLRYRFVDEKQWQDWKQERSRTRLKMPLEHKSRVSFW
jgi:hypothetical protein